MTKNWVILVSDAHYSRLPLLKTTKGGPEGVCYRELTVVSVIPHSTYLQLPRP